MAFNKEFFGRIGESLSKTAKDLGVKASNVYEGQKIKSRISSEEKNIEKLKTDIGTLIYSRFENGEVYEGELGRLCQEITESLERITLLEKESASIRDMKICPCCHKEIPKAALFCPSCGAPCPVPEPEQDVPDMEEDGFEEEPEIVETEMQTEEDSEETEKNPEEAEEDSDGTEGNPDETEEDSDETGEDPAETVGGFTQTEDGPKKASVTDETAGEA